MTTLMVQGCSSWAGKSLLATALARSFARRGARVAPFKAFNMSNNARVVEGGEIATAQYLQALAAGVRPDVRMNPVLVKPEGDTRSQVVVWGKVDPMLSRTPWRGRTEVIWPRIEEAFRSLEASFDLIVAEGAGSPAEFNLWDTDVANMRVAELARASVLLIADIDRGGAFAHLYGTWSLLPDHQRALIDGFVLNRFRGDQTLLEPGPAELERLTGVPVVGVVPYLRHGLPDEDGATETATFAPDDAPTVAVIRYPTASNLDEFKALESAAHLRWARVPADLGDADLVVLPGSKHVASDLAWLRDRGFPEALRARAARGGRVLAICGGLQMLGDRIHDPDDVEGAAVGLGSLPLVTTFDVDKVTRRTEVRFRPLPAPWAELGGLGFDGYEIHFGRTEPIGSLAEAVDGGLGYVAGSVLALYVHGMFESPGILRALFGVDATGRLDDTFEDLAGAIEASLDASFIEGILERIGLGRRTAPRRDRQTNGTGVL